MKDANFLTLLVSFYPKAKVERLNSPANHSTVLYTITIQPADVESSFGLSSLGKGFLFSTLGTPQKTIVRLSGPGILYLNGKEILKGPGEKDIPKRKSRSRLELFRGKPEDLTVSQGTIIKNRLQDSRDVREQRRRRRRRN